MDSQKELDLEYQNAKWFQRKYINFLPFVIRKINFGFNSDYLENSKDYYSKFNEKNIRLELVSNKLDSIGGFTISSFLVILFSILIPYFSFDTLKEWKKYFIYPIIFSVPFIIAAFFHLIRYIKSPASKHVIFDRENNLIKMPKYNAWHYFSIPFHHLRATIRIEVSGQYHIYFFNDTHRPLPWRNEKLDMELSGLYKEPIDSWSFYVWYMVKNRPLPPGTAFDKFREKDFQRRKAEGFPPPLYKSEMATPEATAEQQLVREAFWKDEDYFATKEEAFFSLWKKNPNKKPHDI